MLLALFTITLKPNFMNRTDIHGDVTGAQISACNVYIYGNATGCQFNNCYVERYDGQTPKVVTNPNTSLQLQLTKQKLVNAKKEIGKLRKENDALSVKCQDLKQKASSVIHLHKQVENLVEQLTNVKINKQALFERRISDLEDKVQVLLEVNHSQARRIRELERSHDNNFDENWEFYPSKKMVKELSEVFTTWLDCEEDL
jgi:predicted RNase H-like nuclease (RuvC/YqgF family)